LTQKFQEARDLYSESIAQEFLDAYAPFLRRDFEAKWQERKENSRKKSLRDIIKFAVDLVCDLNAQNPEFRILLLHELGKIKFDAQHEYFRPHAGLKVKEHDDDEEGVDPKTFGWDARGIDLVIEPTIIRAGTSQGENYDLETVLHQGVVWMFKGGPPISSEAMYRSLNQHDTDSGDELAPTQSDFEADELSRTLRIVAKPKKAAPRYNPEPPQSYIGGIETPQSAELIESDSASSDKIGQPTSPLRTISPDSEPNADSEEDCELLVQVGGMVEQHDGLSSRPTVNGEQSPMISSEPENGISITACTPFPVEAPSPPLISECTDPPASRDQVGKPSEEPYEIRGNSKLLDGIYDAAEGYLPESTSQKRKEPDDESREEENYGTNNMQASSPKKAVSSAFSCFGPLAFSLTSSRNSIMKQRKNRQRGLRKTLVKGRILSTSLELSVKVPIGRYRYRIAQARTRRKGACSEDEAFKH
jgi:hypothetical protein